MWLTARRRIRCAKYGSIRGQRETIDRTAHADNNQERSSCESSKTSAGIARCEVWPLVLFGVLDGRVGSYLTFHRSSKFESAEEDLVELSVADSSLRGETVSIPSSDVFGARLRLEWWSQNFAPTQ